MKRNVALLATSQALLMSGQVVLLATASLVGAVLAPIPSLTTLPSALSFVAGTAITIPASLFMRRMGRRVGFVAGAVVGVAAGLVAAVAIVRGSFALFCIGTLLAGVYGGFGSYYRFAAADAADDAFRSRAISYVMAGGVVAAFVGSNLATWSRGLLPDAIFAGSFLAFAGLAVLSAIVLVFVDLPRPQTVERGRTGRPLATIARQPEFGVAVLVGMVGYGVMVFLMTATPLAMKEHAFAFGSVAFVIEWHVLGMFAPSFVTGTLIRRIGTLPVMGAGGLLMVGTVVANLMGAGLWHFWAALVLLGIGWNFVYVGATTLLTGSYRPEEKAKAQGLNELVVFAGVACASLSAGALVRAVGWREVNLASAPFILVALAAVGWLWLRTYRSAAATAGRPEPPAPSQPPVSSPSGPTSPPPSPAARR